MYACSFNHGEMPSPVRAAKCRKGSERGTECLIPAVDYLGYASRSGNCRAAFSQQSRAQTLSSHAFAGRFEGYQPRASFVCRKRQSVARGDFPLC